MKVDVAAEGLQMYIDTAKLSEVELGDKTSKPHLRYMIWEIIEGRVTGRKAHRWLGYVQGVLVHAGRVTVEQMKKLNLGSSMPT